MVDEENMACSHIAMGIAIGTPLSGQIFFVLFSPFLLFVLYRRADMPIDARTGIFYERQSGGLCRLHSLNAFFGRAEITPKAFSAYVKEYDCYLRARFNITTSSASFDLVNSDQTNLVAFILRHYGIHVRYYALNSLYKKPLDPDILTAPFVFVYDQSHIKGVRRGTPPATAAHYCVDSARGVRPYSIQALKTTKNIGVLVPVKSKHEWRAQVDSIRRTLGNARVETKADLVVYLTHLNKKKQVLGDLEIPMGVAVSILETGLPARPCEEFRPIEDLVRLYNGFVAQFTRGRYGDLELILRYVPDVIFTLIAL
jgi:hypothetical protein